jgi:hypothetical protein
MVTALWTRLWPEARRVFAFRLSFGPADVYGSGLTVVATLPQLQARWHGYEVIDPQRAVDPPGEAEALLLGQPNGEDLRDLISRLGPWPASMERLRLYEDSLSLLRSLRDGNDPEAALQLVRLLSALSPHPKDGKSEKAEALQALVAAIAYAQGTYVARLANLEVTALEGAQAKLAEAVRDWTRQRLLQAPTAETSSLLERALDPHEDWWGQALQQGLAQLAREQPPRLAKACWGWLAAQPDRVGRLLDLLTKAGLTQSKLAVNVPRRLDAALARNLIPAAERLGWGTVHAVALAEIHSPGQALEAFLQGPFANDSQALEALCERLPPREVLDFALRTPRPALYHAAAQATRREPKLMQGLDVLQVAWREIWRQRVMLGASLLEEISDPTSVLHRLLDARLEGQEDVEDLLGHLAQAGVDDLTHYPRRSDVWHRLGSALKSAFLKGTALRRLEALAQGEEGGEELEPPLLQEMLAEATFRRAVTRGQAEPGRLVRALLERFPTKLQEAHLRAFAEVLVDPSIAQPDTAALASLGEVIAHKHLRGLAEELMERLRLRPHHGLVVVLQRAALVLSQWDRLYLRLHGGASTAPLEVDPWRLLEEVLAELYHAGPKSLWQRLRGDVSQLHLGGTARDQWAHAVHLIRNGGEPSLKKILSEVRRDFPGNERVQMLWDFMLQGEGR